jgi:hypothetical protein
VSRALCTALFLCGALLASGSAWAADGVAVERSAHAWERAPEPAPQVRQSSAVPAAQPAARRLADGGSVRLPLGPTGGGACFTRGPGPLAQRYAAMVSTVARRLQVGRTPRGAPGLVQRQVLGGAHACEPPSRS